MRALPAFALAVAACSSSPAAPPAAVASIAVVVDDGSAVIVAVPADGTVALAGLIPTSAGPPTAWTSLEVHGLEQLVLDPFSAYRDLRFELAVGPRGVTFEGYRPAAAGAPPHVVRELARPRVAVLGVTQIRVRTHPAPLAGLELPEFAPIALRVGTTDTELGAAQLAGVPTVTLPRRNRGTGSARTGSGAHAPAESKPLYGWTLRDVVASQVHPSAIRSLTITGDGAPQELSGDQLRAGDVRYVLRPNNRRQLVLRGYRGDDEVMSLRGVTRIAVLVAP